MDPNAQNPTPPVPGGTKPLDPKLQEAYDKVMNFNVSPSGQPPTPPTGTPSLTPLAPTPPMESTPAISVSPLPPTPTPPTSPATSMFSTTPAPFTPPSEPNPAMQVSPATPSSSVVASAPMHHDTPTVVINNDVSASHDAKVPTHPQEASVHAGKAVKKGNSLMPLLLVVGALVFIVLYAVIWVKIFNIQLPF